MANTETQKKSNLTPQIALTDFVERAYLDYSMYVVLDRALPSICDGLKPVQRRIAYAMLELGLNANAKPKKSARTIGDVIGKYHPHGDMACYEAMVLMGQPFTYRYPLIEGQGNWGSIDDPKSFAAMRYTEARLTPYADTLLAELGQGTVGWRRNFDGSLDEPEVLPARLPNLLLNGASGIAVGMSTDIPPHNLIEVYKACICLLDKTRTPVEKLLGLVQGPDFPSGGEIIDGLERIAEIYKTGNGVLRVRATYTMEKNDIVITSLPYQVSITRIMRQIGSLVRKKKFTLIKDLRDESDQDHCVRLVIGLKRKESKHKQIMSHLFAHTDLERTYHVNMNVIGMDGKPQVKPLRQLLLEWLDFRKRTVRCRLQWRLNQINRRLEELEGLRIAYANLDTVIRIIRESDKPKANLIKHFRFSESQAEVILELRLRRLAKLEQIKIDHERQTLNAEKDGIERCLGSTRRLKTLIKRELTNDMQAYGDSRKTRIIARPQAQAMDIAELIPVEKVTIVLSKMGWIRVIKGHEVEPTTLDYRDGDEFLAVAYINNNQSVVFLDTVGRCYTLSLHQLPSSRGYGEPLSRYLSLAENSAMVGVVVGNLSHSVMLANNAGYAFYAPIKSLMSRGRAGKQILNLGDHLQATALSPVPKSLNWWAVAINRSGHMLVVSMKEIPFLSKGKGNKLISISNKEFIAGNEQLIAVACVSNKDTLRIHAGRRIKLMAFEQLSEFIGKRGQRGLKLPKLFRNVNRIEVLKS